MSVEQQSATSTEHQGITKRIVVHTPCLVRVVFVIVVHAMYHANTTAAFAGGNQQGWRVFGMCFACLQQMDDRSRDMMAGARGWTTIFVRICSWLYNL